MTLDEYKQFLKNKRCSHCDTPIDPDWANFTEDPEGWKIAEVPHLVVLYVYCKKCPERIIFFSELGIREMDDTKYPVQ